MITIHIDPPPNLDYVASRLAHIPGALERAGRRAVVRTLRGGRQDAARKVGQRYTIKVGEVTKTIRVKSSGLSGEMTSRGPRNPLKKFRLRPRSRPRRMPAGGVFVQNVKGQGGFIRRGFLKRNGNVYERVGRPRFPLRHLKGPSAPGMLGNPHVGPFIEQKMFERMQINLDHAMNAILGGF